MSMRVRRLGAIAVTVVAGASLLRSSTPFAVAGALLDPNLNLSLSIAGTESLANGQVWIVRGKPARSFRAAERGSLFRPVRFPDGLAAVTVTVKVGGRRTVPLMTNAAGVGELLRALGVRVGRSDVVWPRRSASLRSGLRLRVIQIRTVVETVQATTPFETLTQYSKDLPADRAEVKQSGAPGLITRSYRVTYRNGREVSRALLSEEVLVPPAARILLQGTAPLPVPESGVQYGQASWYDWSICDGPGLTAAHVSIPKGTEVTVTNTDNGQSVTVVINDRGPYGVPGRIIDLCDDAFVQLAPLSQGVADVVITW